MAAAGEVGRSWGYQRGRVFPGEEGVLVVCSVDLRVGEQLQQLWLGGCLEVFSSVYCFQCVLYTLCLLLFTLLLLLCAVYIRGCGMTSW